MIGAACKATRARYPAPAVLAPQPPTPFNPQPSTCLCVRLHLSRSTWVTINTDTRRPAKIPEDVKQRFRRLAPSPPRFAIAADQARKKLPDFEWPAQVGGLTTAQRAARHPVPPHMHGFLPAQP